MIMRSSLKQKMLSLDFHLANVGVTMKREKGVIVSFLFHSLFQSESETLSGVMDPQQGITVQMFADFVRYFHSQGYEFVSPDQLASGLNIDGKYVLLTFDDGYYNNLRAIPVLEQFGAPAVFFISTAFVKSGNSFWWDVVYREERKRGNADSAIKSKIGRFKRLMALDIKARLNDEYGSSAVLPVSDADRPFHPSELRDFSKHSLVFLGNHTRDHAILTNYSHREIADQISLAQREVEEMTGLTPKIIAYPNGSESAAIRAIAKKVGLQFGIGVRPGRIQLPISADASESMNLNRFTLWGDRDIEQQCLVSRSPVSAQRIVQELKRQFFFSFSS
jgi:peptidoglycan/xylan/chitin deacetylase (PgdA/CDA1 family)